MAADTLIYAWDRGRFNIPNMILDQKRLSKWIIDYGLKPSAVAGYFVLLALIWTFPLQGVMAYPFVLLFFGAIFGSAWFGGLVAGLLAIAMSFVLITFLFIPPLYSISVAKESRSYLAAYVLCAIVITVVSSVRKRAEYALRAARDELETRVQERTAELKRSTQEIIERERQLRRLTEAIPQQIWSTDAAGRIDYCNRDLIEHLGKPIEDLRGEAFFTIIHPEDAVPFLRNWDTARDLGGRFEVQARILGANGAYRWFLVRSIPERAVDGTIVRWYGVHIDIDEQHRAQQELLVAQDALSQFTRSVSLEEMAASIAHELHQPLSALVTHASACEQWLRAEPPNLDKASLAAQRMARDSVRAGAIIGRVRSLFNKADYVREPTNLNKLILDLVRLLRTDANRRGMSIKLRLAENLPELHVDPVQIQQVLLNLANNSMDAMMKIDGPRILEICSEMPGTESVIVSVKDRGAGFSEEIQARMFEPFFTTKTHGTGIGLSICRSIIEAHEGNIWAQTTEHGAIFQFSLKADR